MRTRMSGTQLARVSEVEQVAVAAEDVARVLLPLTASHHLTIITSLAEFSALEKQWLELEAACNSPFGFFQSFAWLHSWAQVYANKENGFELCIVAGLESGKLAFAWPLMKVKQGPLTVLRWLTDPFGQYGDVIALPGQNITQWMAKSEECLGRQRGIDCMRLRHVRDDALCAPYLKRTFHDARAHDQAPYLDLSAYADEKAYDDRYTSVQRKRRKKIRKALEARGTVDFHQLPPGSMGDALIDEAISEKNKWLEERGRQNRFLKCPKNAKFIKQLSRRRTEGFQTILTETTAGSEAVSWEIGFNYRGTHYGFITSHRNELTDLSPSRLHMDLSQRLSLKQGMKRFDLMVPNDAHKESWSSHKTATNDYYRPMSVTGHAYGLVYLRGIRPRLRAAYYKAPQWALRWISALAAVFIAS